MLFDKMNSPLLNIPDAEFVSHRQIDTFAIYECSTPVIKAKLHHHSFFEMIYVTKGSITHSVNGGESTTISSGQFILIDIGTSHSFYGEDAALLNVIFTTNLIDKKSQNGSSLNFLLQKSHSGIEKYSFSFPSDTVLQDTNGVLFNMLLFLKHKFDSPDILSSKIYKNCVISFLMHILEPHIKPKQEIHPISEFCAKLVEENYFEHNLMERAVNELHSTKPYISAVFKKDFDISFTEYLQRFRIDTAKQLLDTTDMSISDISFAIGYSSVKFFRNIFKKYTNISPMQYKKTHQNKTL